MNKLADVIEKFAVSVMKVLPQQQEQEEPEAQVVVDQQGQVTGQNVEIEYQVGKMSMGRIEISPQLQYLYNWWRTKFKMENVSVSDWIDICMLDYWRAKGMDTRLALNKLGKGVMQTGK